MLIDEQKKVSETVEALETSIDGKISFWPEMAKHLGSGGFMPEGLEYEYRMIFQSYIFFGKDTKLELEVAILCLFFAHYIFDYRNYLPESYEFMVFLEKVVFQFDYTRPKAKLLTKINHYKEILSDCL